MEVSQGRKLSRDFIVWRAGRDKNIAGDLRRLHADFRVWFNGMDDKSHWCNLSATEIDEFVDELTRELLHHEGLLLAAPRLSQALQNTAGPLFIHREPLLRSIDRRLANVIPLRDRKPAYGVFLGNSEGQATDVKPVRAAIVPGQLYDPDVVDPWFFAAFDCDRDCEDALRCSVQTCRSLFCWWRFLFVQVVSMLGSSPLRVWTQLRVLPSELASAHAWSRFLVGSQVYIDIGDGEDHPPVNGPSIFGSALIAILLALEALPNELKPHPLPRNLRRFLLAVQTGNIAVSAAGTQTGWLKPVGEEHEKIRAVSAAKKRLVLPKSMGHKSERQPSEHPERTQTLVGRALSFVRASGPEKHHPARYRHAWSMILREGRLWNGRYFAMYVALFLGLHFRSMAFQTATISGGRAQDAGREFVGYGHNLRGLARESDVITVRIRANSYSPPLYCEVQSANPWGVALSTFAPVAPAGFKANIDLPVDANGEVRFRYYRNETSGKDTQDVPELSLRNWRGQLLDRKELSLLPSP